MDPETSNSLPVQNGQKRKSAFARSNWKNRYRPNYQTVGPREKLFALEISTGSGPSRPRTEIDGANQRSFMDERLLTIDIDLNTSCPFKGWKLYFPHEGLVTSESTLTVFQ